MKNQFLQFISGLGVMIIAVALLLFVPSLSAIYMPICLAVFCALNLTESKWQSIVLFVITFSATAFLSYSVYFALLCVLLPYALSVIASALIKKSAGEKSLTLIFGIANALFFAGVIYFAKDEIGGIDGLFAQMSATFNQNVDMLAEQGLIDAEMKSAYLEMLGLILQQLRIMAPSMLFVFSAITGYITVWILWLVSKFIKPAYLFKPTFSRFKCNTVTSGMTILVCLLSIFIKDGVLGVALDNAFAIFSFLLCVCTASLADYWLKSKNWVTIVRIIIVLFLLSNYSGSILSLLMCMIAIMDARVDFRRLEIQED